MTVHKFLGALVLVVGLCCHCIPGEVSGNTSGKDETASRKVQYKDQIVELQKIQPMSDFMTPGLQKKSNLKKLNHEESQELLGTLVLKEGMLIYRVMSHKSLMFAVETGESVYPITNRSSEHFFKSIDSKDKAQDLVRLVHVGRIIRSKEEYHRLAKALKAIRPDWVKKDAVSIASVTAEELEGYENMYLVHCLGYMETLVFKDTYIVEDSGNITRVERSVCIQGPQSFSGAGAVTDWIFTVYENIIRYS